MLSAALLMALAVLLWPVRGKRSGAGCAAARGLGARVGRVARVARVAPRAGAAGRGAWVADLAEVTAVGLDAGLDLASAALASARSPGVVERASWLHGRLEAAHAGGHPVSACLEAPAGATTDERRDLALLAAAWRLTEEVGAGAAHVTAAAAAAVRARRAAGERAGVVAAGPRASMWLLTALPLLGPLTGLLVGIGPDRLYASGPARLAAVVGAVLTGVGWWWSRFLLDRARRPGRTTGSPA